MHNQKSHLKLGIIKRLAYQNEFQELVRQTILCVNHSFGFILKFVHFVREPRIDRYRAMN